MTMAGPQELVARYFIQGGKEGERKREVLRMIVVQFPLNFHNVFRYGLKIWTL